MAHLRLPPALDKGHQCHPNKHTRLLPRFFLNFCHLRELTTCTELCGDPLLETGFYTANLECLPGVSWLTIEAMLVFSSRIGFGSSVHRVIVFGFVIAGSSLRLQCTFRQLLSWLWIVQNFLLRRAREPFLK